MAGSAPAFVRRHTRLVPVPGLAGIRLHLADDTIRLWHAVQVRTGDPDAALPYWGVAWGGGLALAHYLREHPGTVRGRRVLDVGSGSGLCAIAAAQAGAATVLASDIDPLAIAAIGLNARAHRVRISTIGRDLLADDPPEVDVILAGDCWYDGGLADRVTTWLDAARARNVDVLLGDPGRRSLPSERLVEIAAYGVRSTTHLEDLALTTGRVYRLRGALATR